MRQSVWKKGVWLSALFGRPRFAPADIRCLCVAGKGGK